MTAAATKLKIAEIADAFEAGAELSATDRAIIVAAARRAPFAEGYGLPER